MKRRIILSAIVFAIAWATGFSIGQSTVKETRNVAEFSRISFGVSGNLYINIGSKFEVVLEGSEALLEDIETEVSRGSLVIKKANWIRNMNEKVTIYITMPEIEGLGVSGSGKAEIRDALKVGDLDLSVSGSGKLITDDIVAASMKCRISGSGDIILGGNGNSNNAEISISGSGSYTGESIEIGSLGISISGSGNCNCNVTESLRASVSGSGNVTYEGNPKVDARVSGSGRIRSK